jgi:hypothetical protein
VTIGARGVPVGYLRGRAGAPVDPGRGGGMWWRRGHEDRRPVRPVGQGIGDGDQILLYGQDRRWTELIDATQELPVRWSNPNPPVATDTTRLVRGHVREVRRGR